MEKKHNTHEDVNDEEIANTARGPKRQCLSDGVFEVDTSPEASGLYIRKSNTARLTIEQHHLDFEESVHNDMVLVHEGERAERREAEEQRK